MYRCPYCKCGTPTSHKKGCPHYKDNGEEVDRMKSEEITGWKCKECGSRFALVRSRYKGEWSRIEVCRDEDIIEAYDVKAELFEETVDREAVCLQCGSKDVEWVD